MDPQANQLSDNSRRIARNTAALYFRMFFLMVVSLFTARIVLNALGAQDRGVYEAVASFVSMMAIISGALSNAISRFLTVEIGKGDTAATGRVFATANAILLLVSAGILLIAEPLGIWYIGNVMNLPDGRVAAAQWIFQFSLGTFILNLLSVPYNACIISHEKMSAFAIIGVIEGLLKLGVALAIMWSTSDRLILYGLLLLLVALTVRIMYAAFCRRFFPESRAGVHLHKEYTGKMFSFAGWNGVASGVYMLNTHGATQLINYFFGVIFNTMRGIALSVENMAKQFIVNVILAINPQITKSYASGNKAYSYDLVCKAVKYAFLIGFTIALPFMFEAESILRLWLGSREVPDGTALFTRLGLVCMVLDIGMNPMNIFVQATGDIKRFYLVTTLIAVLIFPLTWIAYLIGLPAYTYYLIFIADFILFDIAKLLIARGQFGFPLSMFCKETVLRLLPVAVASLLLAWLVWALIPAGVWRLLAVLVVGTLAVAVSSYFFALTPGERSFVDSKLKIRRNHE